MSVMINLKNASLLALVAAPLATSAGSAVAATPEASVEAQVHISVDHLGRPHINGERVQNVVHETMDLSPINVNIYCPIE